MAYIKGFTYDIFISYAHIDNRSNSWENLGWIERFHEDLEIALTRRIGTPGLIKIWWDKRKLDGSILFDTSIQEGIKQSAIMICLTSPGYLASDYCKKELELFYTKAQKEDAGLKIGERSRIFNVLLNNIPFDQWPPALSGTTGFHFHDAKNKDDFGDPLEARTDEFKNQFKVFREALYSIMTEFPLSETIAPSQPPPGDDFTIYVGEVADTLRSTKKRTINELTKKGFRIISDIPPPDETKAHEQRVKEELKRSDLAVHLLDSIPGREIQGAENDWYTLKQAELSLDHAQKKLIWVPSELNIEEVEEEKYKKFMQGLEDRTQSASEYEYIRGSKSSLTQEIAELAEKLKAMKEQQKRAALGDVSVLLDTHFTDQAYAIDLGKKLQANRIPTFINPQEDDPQKNINVLADRISKVQNLIFFYGKVSRDWVLERMRAALQLIITNNYPVEDFYVFLAPPHKDPTDVSLKQRFLQLNVLDNSDNPFIEDSTLKTLLNRLKK